MSIARSKTPGLYRIDVAWNHLVETHITLTCLPGETVAAAIQRLAQLPGLENAAIAKLDVFGPCANAAVTEDALRNAFRNRPLPLQWVEGLPCDSTPVAGLQAVFITGDEVEPLTSAGRPAGYAINTPSARYVWLGGILPRDPSATDAEQAHDVFEQITSLLDGAGVGLNALTRTWLYNRDILAWYGVFNAVRTAFFQEHGVFDNLVPASTGIGAVNPVNAALIVSALAMKPQQGTAAGHAPRAYAVESPMQCTPRHYGSSFSRAVEIADAPVRRLMISGTASISYEGITEHVGDVEKQIALTMEVAEAILQSRGMSFDNTVRALAYFRYAADAPAFSAYCAGRGLDLPVVVNESTVCRDDLLFEIELDAMCEG